MNLRQQRADTVPPAPRPGLTRGQLDLWMLRLPRPERLPGVLDLADLNEAERTRAASFIRPQDGVLYTAAHIALRRVLGPYLDLDPQELAFVREPCPGCGEPHGRPAVAAPDPPLHFSLSHSSGMVLVGVASDPIGADVEKIPGTETVEVCTPALHPDERAELAAVPQESRRTAFGQVWTRKEAYLKGIGTGLSRDPAKDYLGVDPARRPAGWTVLDVPSGPRHNAAAAVRGTAPSSVTVRWLPVDSVLVGGSMSLWAAA